MELKDVKIDGDTEYFCRKNGKLCVIEATFVSCGATLVACDISEENFFDLWFTEACFLTLAET